MADWGLEVEFEANPTAVESLFEGMLEDVSNGGSNAVEKSSLSTAVDVLLLGGVVFAGIKESSIAVEWFSLSTAVEVVPVRFGVGSTAVALLWEHWLHLVNFVPPNV